MGAPIADLLHSFGGGGGFGSGSGGAGHSLGGSAGGASMGPADPVGGGYAGHSLGGAVGGDPVADPHYPQSPARRGVGYFPQNHPKIYGAMGGLARTVGGGLLGSYLGRQESRAVNAQEMAQSNYIAQANMRAIQMQADNQRFLNGLQQDAINQMAAARAQSSGVQQQLQSATLGAQVAANAAIGAPLVNNSGDYNGLLTLGTSPQGDMSRPNLGRSRLVGS